ncbi:MAG: histidine kinase [Bacteroidota bacterium]
MQKSRLLTLLIHTMVWAVYISLPLFILPRPSEFLNSSRIYLLLYFMISAFTIAFFYFNYFLAVPHLYFKRKYLRYALAILGFLVISALLTRIIIIINLPSVRDAVPRNTGIPGNFLSRFLLIFIVSLGLRYRERMKQLESDRIKAELSALKSQINPHFLFNTLNSIYGQALSRSDQTADSIAKLSSMMRYVLTESDAEKVGLDSEIAYITSYVHLQRIRLTDRTDVVFEVTGNTASAQIPPLLFISFIENAFKYGISNETKSRIMIKIAREKEGLSVQVSNHKVMKVNNNSMSNNIGIHNTRRRLDLLYGERYSLDIAEDEHWFHVNLKIEEI